MRILIIEDDKEINKLLAVFLEKNGYDTVRCFNGVDGLNLVKKLAAKSYAANGFIRENEEDNGLAPDEKIDMILLDMMLPGFFGR